MLEPVGAFALNQRCSNETHTRYTAAKRVDGYTRMMMPRLAALTGTAMTAVAGALMVALSFSAFGAAPTLLAFVALFLLAATTHRAIIRHR
jgi:hypothetical protein